MSNSPKDWLETIRSLLSTGFTAGLIGLVGSFTILVLMRAGYMNANAFSGYAKDGAELVFALSITLILIGLAQLLIRGLGKGQRIIATFIAKKRESKNEKQQISQQINLNRQNVMMLSPGAKLFLLYYLNEPNGRFVGPDENRTSEELYRHQMFNVEANEGMILFMSYSNNFCRLDEILYSDRVYLAQSLRDALQRDFTGDLFDPATVAAQYRNTLDRYRAVNRFF